MASGEVKLLGSWQSPFVLRARIALNIKAVVYEFQQEEVLVAKSDLLLESNPVHKKIPVLIHHANPISESLIIVHYVDEVWASGPAILPSDPYDRAVARFWASYVDNTLFEQLQGNLFAEGEEANKAEEGAIKGLVVMEEALRKCSGGEMFFGGEEIGYVDIALGCFLPLISLIHKARSISLLDESNTPNLFKWAHHFSSHRAVKDVFPDADELYQLVKFVAAPKADA